MAERSTVPTYSEEYATRWLAWLAYHMRERDITLFEIENLQPDWLTSVREQIVHLVFTRLCWGMLSSLIFVLVFELVQLWILRSALTLTSTLINGIIIGPIFGASIGLIEFVSSICKPDILLQNRTISHLLTRRWANISLDSYRELWAFSNAAKSLLAGMIAYGLIGFMIAQIVDWASGGQISTLGVLLGAIFGLLEFITPSHKFSPRFRFYSSKAKRFLTGTIKYSLIGGLVWHFASSSHLPAFDGAINGLIFRLIYVYRATRNKAGGPVYTFELIQWSWQHVRQTILRNLIFGFVFGLIVGPISGSSSIMTMGEGDLTERIVVGPIQWIIIGPIYALLIGIFFGGFQPVTGALKEFPNQGVWTTMQSAIKIGIRNGLVLGSVMMLGNLLSGDIIISIFYGLTIFFVTALWYGGLDVIEHAIIRLIIAWRGHAPLNYARFLDYAANELNFLQKVGGGYVFIHRYLLEHFAEIAVERGYVDVNARRHPQSF